MASIMEHPARTLYAYDAVESTELSVAADQRVTIVEVNPSGWSLVRMVDDAAKSGWMPTSYLEKLDKSDLDLSDLRVHDPNLAQPAGEGSSSTASSTTTSSTNSTASTSSTASSAPRKTHQAIMASQNKTCHSCREPIISVFVIAGSEVFHPNHFRCAVCQDELGGRPYIARDQSFYCERDYYKTFNPKCAKCNEVIQGMYLSALDVSWHPEHFACTACDKPFPSQEFRIHDSKPYCEEDFLRLFAPKCYACSQAITGQAFEALDRKYHVECFKCTQGEHRIQADEVFHVHEGNVYCSQHFEEMFLIKCDTCHKPIRGQYLKIVGKQMHSECWICAHCHTVLRTDSCVHDAGVFYCRTCHQQGLKEVVPVGSSAPAPAAAAAAPAPAASTPAPAPAASTPAAAPAASAPAASAPAPAAAASTPADAPAASTPAAASVSAFYSLDVLRDSARRPADVDPAHKERYLSPEDFAAAFHMSFEAFVVLPQWRQQEMKKKVGLF